MTETEKLLQILEGNKTVQTILKRAGGLNMPNWYLGSGCIAQTVWNHLHGFEREFGIKDYDLAYYDGHDISYEGEDVFIKKGEELFRNIPVVVEIRNQARIHLWYGTHFGQEPITQHGSVEDAIKTWPTTATSVGVRYAEGQFHVFAPFGLGDIFGMVVRANKVLVSREIYEEKASRWKKLWPKLTIVPWDEK